MKAKRHAAILRLVREHQIPSQERLRELLVRAGFDVTQATLSRDIRELGLSRTPDADGTPVYAASLEEILPSPALSTFLPSLLLKSEGVGPLLVLRTPTGSASTLAAALDHEEWPEVLGTIAGDDTLLIIARTIADRKLLARRVAELAGPRH
ncbi:MAG: arginine repressor [Gemmatimonadota bacterium]|jgi:transcriptional regulator of arginine metabolism